MNRIYHTWDKWECYPAGFYNQKPPKGMEPEEAEKTYTEFLRDDDRFSAALSRVIQEWPHSCEHYLTNENMNRIAWLGQASCCIATGIPACFRGGFNKLSEQEKDRANTTALRFLNAWLTARNGPYLSPEEAASKTEANLY